MKKLIIILLIVAAAFLRLIKLDQVPASMYWEEVAIGYDAYSVAKTGLDHHGNKPSLVAFESFGDYKPALYFYFVAPLTRWLGLNVWAVRLPSALAGISLVLVIGLLAQWFAREVGYRSAKDQSLAMIGAIFFSTISPWLINFSRGGWESNLATALIAWAVWLTLNHKKLFQLVLAMILFSAATYTYHAARVIAPGLLVLSLAYLVFKNKNKRKSILKSALLCLGLFFLFSLPLVLPSNALEVSHRFAETSIFSNLQPIIESNQRRARAGNSLLSRILYHRYVYFAKELLSNGLSHLSPSYLFLNGDTNPRHGGLGGILNPLDSLLLLLASYLLIKKNKLLAVFAFSWLVVAILPASTAKAVPHALRTLAAAPLYLALSALGLLSLRDWLAHSLVRKNYYFKLALATFISLYLIFFVRYYWHYLTVYPVQSATDWQVGYQPMLIALNQYRRQFPSYHVYITREQGRPAMYYWFFNQVDPREVQKSEMSSKKDQGEFLEFQNIDFIDRADQVKKSPAILVASPKFFENSSLKYKILAKIDHIWWIGLI